MDSTVKQLGEDKSLLNMLYAVKSRRSRTCHKKEVMGTLSSLMNKANKDRIGSLIQELPFRKRLVLEMAMCGYSFNEIAKTLEVSRQMARQLLCEEIRRIACQICTDFSDPETQIDNIMMPTRCYNALKRLNIQTIRDITSYSERQLLRSYGMGVRCLGTVKKVLSQFGLSLG